MKPADPPPRKKKPYVRPTLRDLGTIAAVTGTAGGSFNAADPSFPVLSQKHFP
jgi:hypothetical protein